MIIFPKLPRKKLKSKFPFMLEFIPVFDSQNERFPDPAG
jgi:hypothetical protein